MQSQGSDYAGASIPTRTLTLTPSAAAPFSVPADSHVPSLHSQLHKRRFLAAEKVPNIRRRVALGPHMHTSRARVIRAARNIS